jgi:hypothetical protein
MYLLIISGKDHMFSHRSPPLTFRDPETIVPELVIGGAVPKDAPLAAVGRDLLPGAIRSRYKAETKGNEK